MINPAKDAIIYCITKCTNLGQPEALEDGPPEAPLTSMAGTMRTKVGGPRFGGPGKCLPQVNQEGVLQALHDLQLLEDISHFVAFHTLLFVHVLHGIHLLGVIFLDDADLTVQCKGEVIKEMRNNHSARR